MTAPTQTPLPLPSLKSVEYNPRTVSDWIQDVPEKKPRRQWYPDSFGGVVMKYTQHLWYVLICLQQQEAEDL